MTIAETSGSDGLAVRFQALADWANAALQVAGEALRRSLAAGFAVAAPHRWEIAAAAAAAIGAIAIWALRSLRRRLQLQGSLAEATLTVDPKTDWLTLAIVMRNLQPYPLLVRSIQIIDPPGTRICDRWQAWRPHGAGVKFVAPELELTDAVSIEATMLPYTSTAYANPTDELSRHYYVRPSDVPGTSPLALGARLVCELQTRRGRQQELVFRATLTHDPPTSDLKHRSEDAET